MEISVNKKLTIITKLQNLERKKLIYILLTAIILTALGVLYYQLSNTAIVANSSDNASMVMQAKDVLRGNIFLKGWSLPSDTYYTIDLPFYVLAVLVLGVCELPMHVVPVAIFILVLILALVISGLGKKVNYLIRLFTILTILGFPCAYTALNSLRSPIHYATQIYILLSILLIYLYDQTSTIKHYTLILLSIAFINMFMLFGDPLFLASGSIPLLIFAFIKADFFHSPLNKKYLVLFVVTIASILFGILMKNSFSTYGALIINVPLLRPLDLDNLYRNIILTLRLILNLFGANVENKAIFNRSNYLIFIRFGFFFFVSIIFVHTLKKLKSSFPSDTINIIVVISLISTILMYILSNIPTGGGEGRYLMSVPILLGVIAARNISTYSFRLKYVVLVCFTCLNFYAFYHLLYLNPPVPNDNLTMANFLLAHKLTRGYGSYWAATICDVLSKDKVVVAPIVRQEGVVVEYKWLSTQDWYNQNGTNFVLYDMNNPYYGVDDQSIKNTFGDPANIYLVGHYKILVWKHTLKKIGSYRPDSSPHGK